MTSNTTGVGTGLENREVDVTGSNMDDRQTGRRKSAFARRKSSAVVDEKPAAIVEASALSDADRRLAEMGYVQVSSPSISFSLSPSANLSVSLRSTRENSLGCPPSPSPLQSPVSSPVSPLPSSTLTKPVALHRPSGAG